jgi:hypothetical protein
MAAPRPDSQGECVAVSMRGIITSLGINLIATAIAWYLGGPNVGVLCFALGLLLLLISYFWPKKSESTIPPPSPPPPIDVRQENKQIVNQQFHFGHDDRSVTERTANKQHDKLALQYIREKKNQEPSKVNFVADVASGIGLTFHETDRSLKRLYDEGFLYRSSIDADGDFVYWYRGPE